MRAALGLTMMVALSGCGGFSGPHAKGDPCPELSEARFAELVEAGATRADATIHASGMIDMTTGPGVVQCASGPQPRACRRPNDLVIRYTWPDGSRRRVQVPAGSQYRFRAGARPTSCEIVLPPAPPSA
ncbi:MULTISPECIES: hypothetical protein [unclassified Sphingomonas]|uniref:hypothetical protein n=1 Tax=unclassified Sphingomonas TaxID=196159 RepID=UPI000836DF06|nr:MULTISPECIES: hypothetical protein [unclassified Sphingomonas]